MKKVITSTFLIMLLASSANAALLSRLSGQAYYDDVLDITWLADANYAKTSGYSGADAYGRMSWDNAQTWIGTLNSGTGYLGKKDWRLPTVNAVDGSNPPNKAVSYNGSTDYGYNASAPGSAYAGSTGSEMAHLFYNTLGNKGYCDPALSTVSCSGPQTDWGLTKTGDFINLEPYLYWLYAPATGNAWSFYVGDGLQSYSKKTHGFYDGFDAWAVRPGDIAPVPVPVPAVAWLFGGALTLLGALLGALRRRAMTALG